MITGKPRLFICVAYFADAFGRFRPQMPKSCGAAVTGSCALLIKDWRERVFGPAFELAVVYCRTHHVCFTLYPPGFTPYGRQPLVNFSPEGFPKAHDPDSIPFEGTLFQAVIDNAHGFTWPREADDGNLQHRLNTQLNHIKRGCLLLGLSRGSPPIFDDCLAHLPMAGTTLHALRERVLAGEGYRIRSVAACELLTLTNESREIFIGTSTLGHLAKLWPKPQVLFAPVGKHDDGSLPPRASTTHNLMC